MYSTFFLWLIVIILIFVLLKLLNVKKNYVISFFMSLFIVIFFVNLNISMTSAIDGCKLWFKAMVPTLFPFLVICNLLISFDGISLYSKILGPILCKPLKLPKVSSFPLAASFLCGYPLGAKYSADVYDLGYINKRDYSRLINIASNCGPLFLIGSVGAAMLGNAYYGYILLIGNYLSILIVGFLLRRNAPKVNSNSSEIKSIPINFGDAFKNSINSAISTTIQVGGFIVIFSVFIGIIKNNASISIIFYEIESFLNIPKDSLYALFLGSIEITNGCNIIANTTLTIPLKLGLISFLCSFSGLSIIAQVSSFISKHNISIIKYSLIKFLQGIISFIITFTFSFFCLGTVLTSTENTVTNLSFYYLFIPIVAMMILYLFCYFIKKLFIHIS